ncbi:MAG: hypothetical protein JW927_10365 [Deltaproteobacteria bacterium]|nr:hypothetical protein [Deltaproteobacteria bacterium]
MSDKKPYIVYLSNWLFGFFFSFLFVWVLSFFFCDTVHTFSYSTEIETWVRPPGSIHRHRSEGWGDVWFGRMDVIGEADISLIKTPSVVIWGDSHMEALQIEQKNRMPQVLTDMFRADNINTFSAFGVGMSGESIADYYLKIPRYEKVAEIKAHYIIICDISDALPDQSTAAHAVYLSEPAYRIVDTKKVPDHINIRKFLRKFELDFLWASAVSILKDTKLRFMPGPFDSDKNVIDDGYPLSVNEPLNFILHSLRHKTEKPIIFVYCPHLPAIKDNTVTFENKEHDSVDVFKNLCFKNGIGFIDMTNEFCSNYKETGKFPRGFQNSLVSQGHFNRDGHRIIAKAIYKNILSTKIIPNAVYTN